MFLFYVFILRTEIHFHLKTYEIILIDQQQPQQKTYFQLNLVKLGCDNIGRIVNPCGL